MTENEIIFPSINNVSISEMWCYQIVIQALNKWDMYRLQLDSLSYSIFYHAYIKQVANLC